jgi:hypothetical protein
VGQREEAQDQDFEIGERCREQSQIGQRKLTLPGSLSVWAEARGCP